METCLGIEGVDEAPHEKKPVMKKVKDKVKKIKNTLEKKMHGEDQYHHHELDVEEDDDDDNDGYEEDDEEQKTDPDVHGVGHHEPLDEVEIKDRVVVGESIAPVEVDPDAPAMETKAHRDGGEEVDLSQPLLTKLEEMTISSQHKKEGEREATRPHEETSAMEYGKKVANMVLEKVKPRGRVEEGEKVADKGVSVREYLVEKLRPGEDDKALSEVISEMVHGTKEEEEEKKIMKGERKMVERIRQTMASLLGASPEHDKQQEGVGNY